LSSTCSRVGSDIQTTMTASIHCVEEAESLEIASDFIAAGDAVVIPTETVFGLTCDAENKEAVENVYRLKGRGMEKPSAISLPSTEAIEQYARIEHGYARRVIGEFLPGPLTIVVDSRRRDWPGVVSEDGRIGIRISAEPFVSLLARNTDRPLLATSANRSGHPDCRNLSMVVDQLGEVVPLILYRRESVVQQPSTVIDLTGSKPTLLREGAISFDRILKRGSS